MRIDKNKFAKAYLEKIKSLCEQIDINQIVNVIKILEKKLRTGRTIFIAGNGGSAATASHMVCDLGKTILGKEPTTKNRRFRIISLSDNIPLLTAIGNDWKYETIFSEPLKNLGQKGDLLLVITGSGNSQNIIKAVQTAQKLKMKTTAFLGFDGGKVKEMVDAYVLVPSNEYGPIEDFHLIFNHLITNYFYETEKKKGGIPRPRRNH